MTNPFVWFSILVAIRDVLSEVFGLSNIAPVSFAFLLCGMIAAFAWLLVLIQTYSRGKKTTGVTSRLVGTGSTLSFSQRLVKKDVLLRCVALGVLGAVVYGVTFYLIGRPEYGAGLFNMIDYGLAPLLTALVGSIVFRNRLTDIFALALGLYFVGILLLHQSAVGTSFLLFCLAVLSPMSSAISDGLGKWLLNRDRAGHLTRSELLAVRFTPAAGVLFALAWWRGEELASLNIPATIVLAVVFGFAPLWILYSALEKGRLTDLAASEFLIPAISFFGTMHLHPERVALGPIFGAIFVGLGYVLYEMYGEVWIKDVLWKK